MIFSNLKYFEFLILEFHDRLGQKGIGKFIWNFFMFPITSNLNYNQYCKWIKVREKISDIIVETYLNIGIKSAQSSRISLKNAFKNYSKNRLIINSNRAHILLTNNYIFIFPYRISTNINDFYTILDSPFRLKINDASEVYKYLDIISVDKIEKLQIKDNNTEIEFLTPDFKENILLTIYEKITIANTL